ncbi:MAG: helix-turn-helix transcriptional regulator [Rivularia sp. (in: cyanobacteria)]
MTITLGHKEWEELWDESVQSSSYNCVSETVEEFYEFPKLLGKGYSQEIELYPELWLAVGDCEYHDDVLTQYTPEEEHTLHFYVLLSGKIIVSNNEQVGEGYTLICGGGIQHQSFSQIKKNQRLIGVDIIMPHPLLAAFFPGRDGQLLPQLRPLVKDNDWQTMLFPKTTSAVQGVAQQIINCPFQGVTKRMYLQGKILELIALQLAPIWEIESKKPISPRLKPDTVARIHRARDILRSRLENPPSSLELAQLVGVSDRTLRRGFRELFDTTVFNYLKQKRMEQAERLLREGNRSVAEVANLVGYSHLGLFAGVFKRHYGISPRECFSGKKSVL